MNRFYPFRWRRAGCLVVLSILAAIAPMNGGDGRAADTNTAFLETRRQDVLKVFVDGGVFAKGDLYNVTQVLADDFANGEARRGLRTRAQWQALASRLQRELEPGEAVWLIERSGVPFMIAMAGRGDAVHTIRFVLRDGKVSRRAGRKLMDLIGAAYEKALPQFKGARRWPRAALIRSYLARKQLGKSIAERSKGQFDRQTLRLTRQDAVLLQKVFAAHTIGDIALGAVRVPGVASYFTVTGRRRCASTPRRGRDILRSVSC